MDTLSVTAVAISIPRLAGRTPRIALSSIRFPFSFRMKWAARSVSVSEGIMTPRLARSAPGIPAVRRPTKVAQLMPRDPGVISATATISMTSEAVIQPYRSTSSLMTGIMVMPPKLQNPIFIKERNNLR